MSDRRSVSRRTRAGVLFGGRSTLGTRRGGPDAGRRRRIIARGAFAEPFSTLISYSSVYVIS